ncbi:MAG: HPr-rel-A system PqqD family peptide chaperone [Sphingopyxis sp.]
MDAAPTNAIWRGPAPGRLRIDPVDSLTLVYDRQSGQTHILAPPLPELLAILANGPLATGAVVAALMAQFDVTTDGEADPTAAPTGAGDDVPARVAQRLDELAQLGLVDRLLPPPAPAQPAAQSGAV